MTSANGFVRARSGDILRHVRPRLGALDAVAPAGHIEAEERR
jgi:hypothetical protein